MSSMWKFEDGEPFYGHIITFKEEQQPEGHLPRIRHFLECSRCGQHELHGSTREELATARQRAITTHHLKVLAKANQDSSWNAGGELLGS